MARSLLSANRILDADANPNPGAVKEVLSYFVRNPQAADNLEGIARWRLMDEVIRRKVEETHQALGWLVGRKFLLETMAAGIAPLFSLNPEKVDEAKAFLSSNDASSEPKNE